jgi:hypothetical protein
MVATGGGWFNKEKKGVRCGSGFLCLWDESVESTVHPGAPKCNGLLGTL